MIFQIFVFPPVANRFGLLPCLKMCSIIFPVTYFLSPFASLFPTSLSRQAFLFTVWLVKGLCFAIAYPISTILLSNSVANPRHLATLNGLATTTSSIGRAVGPLIMGPMFMVGVNKGYIIVPFWTLAFITALAAIPVFYLIDPDEEADKIDFE
jgi:MFS family permease